MNAPAPRGAAGPTVALVLGSGGARGLAHIGVIEVLRERGYRVVAIAGSSMGALVGGIHAAGRLDDYKAWACALQKLDVLRLVDWTLSPSGFIRGERVIAALRGLVGEAMIEDLPVAYTAVATDIDLEREVWLSRGPLFDAIRASIAIPSLFTPVRRDGHTLVDGGLLNPLPVSAVLHAITDLTIAVDVNAPDERLRRRALEPAPPVAPAPAAAEPAPGDLRARMAQFIEGLFDRGAAQPEPVEPSWRDLLSRSLETMQGAITRMKLATHTPEIVIRIPRNAAAFYEFYRAAEMIELGRARATRALDKFEARLARG
ncbi:MAG: patatin-like phospholipase family protein [Xanthomonadaceae bacterium]|nr:patatin-like phospholipase family protein [Xanthomonadaceae bacterium]